MTKTLTLVLALLTLTACNTVEGVGADISGGANIVRGWIGR
ncbi:entericidin [Pararhodobacter zhoushanensis]|uniref:Entericidin EcnA/B family protein n=1 Tax=Pararhodobacter zhoushanensis TaxID=2479545 RepID=A0ABT3H0H8_9RHOB|nr:entericidin [Pararhodobacter zhoushanensis]MCW1933289.1 hypothetical protein [Pararhodobacter zhoushanensis]